MKHLFLLFLLSTFVAQAAVHVNYDRLGEVLLLPYYTTNNGFNTLITVSNTTEQVKALKIVFREGKYDLFQISINVYLAPNDVWSSALVKSGVTDAKIFSNDLSCVPFSTFPVVLRDYWGDPPGPNGVGFAEGMIEVYEMGELDPSYGYGEAVTFENGMPKDCEQIEDNWQTGAWSSSQGQTQMLPAAGGLMATLSLIDVASGINYTYDAIALNGFYPEGVLIHTSPLNYNYQNLAPALNDAENVSMVQYEGENIITQWPTGVEAVSAVLSKSELMMDYSNELSINAQTEVVMSFPTRGLYSAETPIPPFEFLEWFSTRGCEFYTGNIYDRDGMPVSYVPGGVSPLPPYLCHGVNVIKIWDHYASESVYYPILDSENTVSQSVLEGEEGMYKIRFNQFTANGQSVDGTEKHTYFGLPVFAWALTSYTNANAQPGLLAQYGGASIAKSRQKIIKEQSD